MPTALEIENASLRSRIQSAEFHLSRLTREQSSDERDEIAKAYARADAAAAYHGKRVSAPKLGETALEYRRRLIESLKQHSPQLKTSRFDTADAATLDVLEPIIYADAVAAGKSRAAPGQLIEIKERDAAGREITRYHGDIRAFLAPFTRGGMRVKINRDAGS